MPKKMKALVSGCIMHFSWSEFHLLDDGMWMEIISIYNTLKEKEINLPGVCFCIVQVCKYISSYSKEQLIISCHRRYLFIYMLKFTFSEISAFCMHIIQFTLVIFNSSSVDHTFFNKTRNSLPVEWRPTGDEWRVIKVWSAVGYQSNLDKWFSFIMP